MLRIGAGYASTRLRVQRLVYLLPPPGKQRSLGRRKLRSAEVLVDLGKLAMQFVRGGACRWNFPSRLYNPVLSHAYRGSDKS